MPLGEAWAQPAAIEAYVRARVRRGACFHRALLSARHKFGLNPDEARKIEWRMTPAALRKRRRMDIIAGRE